jgi:hypothetical protein
MSKNIKKQNYTIEKIDGYAHGILLDAATIKKFVGKEKRLLCTINDHTQHSAILKSKEKGYYIMLGATTLKKLKLKPGNIVKASFEKDTSIIQFEENAVLSEVLITDPTAQKIYNKLTDGNKRSLHYLITMVKNTDKQIERALLIAEKLKMGITKAQQIMKK